MCYRMSKFTIGFQFHLQKIFFRNLSLSNHRFKVVPNNLKNKSASSNEWITRQLNDQYVKKSRYESYRCRSAFKLLEIDERFKILKPGMSVVDCGAAPGSWTQVVVKKVKSFDEGKTASCAAIAIDLQHIEPIKGAIILKDADFTHLAVQEQVRNLLPNKSADVVLSDMAPNVTGIRDLDIISINNLVYSAFTFSLSVLKVNGTFLCKTFDNPEVLSVVKHMNSFFLHVNRVKPKASRSDSTEIFLLARDFKGAQMKTEI